MIFKQLSRNFIWRWIFDWKETKQPDYLKNFIELEDMYRKVDNIHALVPQYLKESDAYKV